MWIAKINIGLRRLAVWVAIALFMAIFINLYIPTIAYVIVGITLGCVAMMMYFLYSYGMYRRRYQFRSYGLLKEVRDYINFRNPKENYRCICHADSPEAKSYDSRIYLNAQDTWAYFDILRNIVTSATTPPQKILVLGAGGGSFLHTLTQTFPQATIDAVEVSNQMIRVANQYFLSKTDLSHIRWIKQDAFSYLRKCNDLGYVYDCIIMDVPRGSRMPRWVYTRACVASLQKASHQQSIIFINFIFVNQYLFDCMPIYRKLLHGFKFYRYGNNFIGTNYVPSKSMSNVTLVA